MTMNKGVKILLLVMLVVVFACGFGFWAAYSPVAYDYRTMYKPVSEADLIFAFATALRINHPAAYDMIDPTLKPRLDDWINTHQSKKCRSEPFYFTIESGTKQGSKSVLDCAGYDEGIRFEVDNIVIKDMRVINWGEVREGN
jgi:hypothetical protein